MERAQARITGFVTGCLIVSLASVYAAAQSSPPPKGAPPRPIASTEGTVVQYLMNHHGEVDGLLLSDGTQVHLPPHMGKDLAALAKPGDSVSVQGYRSSTGPVVVDPVITNTKTGQSITEREPSPLDRPILPPQIRDLSLTERHAEGTVRNLLYGPRGDVNGVVLEDHTIVRVPPPAAHEVAKLLQVGRPITAVGYGTENEYGHVMEATAIGTSEMPMTTITRPGARGKSR
ncbi:MAG TPA: hypothetical protein VJ746_17590 [Nitrospira sp.]|nr:hypothetical protein [Nitrospira sp.]